MRKTIVTALCALTLSAGSAWAAGTDTAPAEETALRIVPTHFSQRTEESLNKQAPSGRRSDGQTAPAAIVTVTPTTGAAASPASPSQTTAVSVTSTEPAEGPQVSQEKKIMLNLASRILTLYEGKTPICMYPVGVGKVSTPTPTGYYSVSEKILNPTWTDPDTGVSISSGPDCPLGYRWLGLFGNYGIHGTNRPDSIGGYVSNGCVRMHEEDVEDLYDRVSVGTSVDIYYDRIVIDRDDDHTISYYIYPDGYGWQTVSVQDVKKALAGYGVEDFAEPAAISSKIAASDGNPTYVAKAYDLYVNGKKMPKRALGKDGVIWLPAFALSTATHTEAEWSGASQTLRTNHGSGSGIVRSDVVYLDAATAQNLYGLAGGLGPDLVYRLQSRPVVTLYGDGSQKPAKPAQPVR